MTIKYKKTKTVFKFRYNIVKKQQQHFKEKNSCHFCFETFFTIRAKIHPNPKTQNNK